MNLQLHIRHGKTLTLRNLIWLVATKPMREASLSRPTLEALGLNKRGALIAACDRFHGELDMEITEGISITGRVAWHISCHLASTIRVQYRRMKLDLKMKVNNGYI